MDTVLLWGGLIAIGMVAVIAFRFFAIRRIGLNRTSVDLQEIRLEDPLKRFFDSDSWRLDIGTEKLNKWLRDIGIREFDAQPVTVLDLLILVESRQESS
jgi:hypothetical protein